MRLSPIVLPMICVGSLVFFLLSYSYSSFSAWQACYMVSILLSFCYLASNFSRLFFLTPLLLIVITVANTLPAVPYLIFEIEPVYNFQHSLYINSLGLITVLSITTLLNIKSKTFLISDCCFKTAEWQRFFVVNGRLFWVTAPLVLAAMYLSGGWKVLIGLIPDSEFSRIGNFKGLGPLMLAASVNVFAGTLYGLSLIGSSRVARGTLVIILMLLLNSFTLGRGSVIQVFMFGLFAYGITRGVTLKILFFSILTGTCIVLMQLLRSNSEDGSGFSVLITLFLKFSADFDSLNNVSHLITYIQDHGFPGWYHIYSFFLNPIPRIIFPDKPHFIGILHLNDLIFPGLYLGEEGGSNFTFGLFGTWYAVNGIWTLLLGSVVSTLFVNAMDIRLQRWARYPTPDIFIIVYLLLLGQIIIYYRDGLSFFVSALIQVPLYLICGYVFGWRPMFKLRTRPQNLQRKGRAEGKALGKILVARVDSQGYSLSNDMPR